MNPSRWCSTCAAPLASLMTLSPSSHPHSSVCSPLLRGLPCLLHPLLIIGFRVDIDPPEHPGMPWAAQFCARELIAPRLRGFEPYLELTPWDRVLLETERRHKEAVDDVVAAEVHTYNLVHRHVDLFVSFIVGRVKQAIRPRIDKTPGKLFGGDADLHIRRRALAFDFRPGRFAHKPDSDEHNGGNDRPEKLQCRVAMRIGRAACLPFPVAVF